MQSRGFARRRYPLGRHPVTGRVLHTSDWHLGRQIGRRYRRDAEFDAVLDEIVEIAADFAPHLIVHSGDLFDGRPTLDDVHRAAQALRRLGDIAPVVVVAGNHDTPNVLRFLDYVLTDMGNRADDLVRVRFATDARPGGLLIAEYPGQRPDATCRRAALPASQPVRLRLRRPRYGDRRLRRAHSLRPSRCLPPPGCRPWSGRPPDLRRTPLRRGGHPLPLRAAGLDHLRLRRRRRRPAGRRLRRTWAHPQTPERRPGRLSRALRRQPAPVGLRRDQRHQERRPGSDRPGQGAPDRPRCPELRPPPGSPDRDPGGDRAARRARRRRLGESGGGRRRPQPLPRRDTRQAAAAGDDRRHRGTLPRRRRAGAGPHGHHRGAAQHRRLAARLPARPRHHRARLGPRHGHLLRPAGRTGSRRTGPLLRGDAADRRHRRREP
ncbi:metallophosphoesterase [Actinophytocola sp. S1-96]|uniref:Metallophosphoesterase n=1 Tax=Actinophytocola gossypii TaxID=2812003 RepID=A0ABT2J1K2_9PSEU|nr:metallophosphoesterase [Actinophytocola gossypii]